MNDLLKVRPDKLKRAELEELLVGCQQEETTRRAAFSARQRMALVIGGVASALIALSVYDLTEGIGNLTGMPLVLCFLLAVGIDIGMIATELAELVAHGDATVGLWARIYMGASTVLSALVNAWVFYHHAPEGLGKFLAIGFGLVLPALVFFLGKVAGHLWTRR